MKKTLLAFTFLNAFGLYAQNPVVSYLPQNNSVYEIFDSAVPLDQSAAGPDVNWDFTSVFMLGETEFEVGPATADMISQFPGTTTFVHQFGAGGDSYLFVAESGANVSITGTDSNGVMLTYTNNAFVGALPMAYGYTQTDAIAGTYVYDTFNGPFTGTITTTVDAYGILSFVEGNSIPVTRVKTVQNMSLTYLNIPNVGTGVQTTYSYYSSDGIMRFTTSTLQISAPLAGINETITTMQGYLYELGIPDSNKLKVSLYPNPSDGLLSIASELPVDNIRISDLSGKVVIDISNPTSQVDIGELTPGVYLATMESGQQKSTQKIIRK